MDYLDLLYDDLLSQGIAHPDWMLGAMAGALTAFFVQLYYWLGRYGGLPRFRNNRGIRPQIPSPPVSVVVVIRENGYYFIENYLPLLLGQRYDEFEVVAVDCSYDEEIGDAHRNADLHLHDLSMLTGYCAGWSLKQLIQEGLGGIPGKITSSPASHLSTLCNQMVNFLGIMQNEWAGAQAFSSFDTYLAPFVKVDHLTQKEVKQCI